ncbi:NADH-quinone oxidoreductase subunit M, partial [Campylobacter sp. CH185]
ASVSLPLTVSFVGEFLILLGIAKINLFYALLAGLVIILGAIYMFAVFRKIFFMQKQSFIENFSLRLREIVALVCIIVMIFGLGLMPNILLKPIQKDVDNLIKTMNIRAVEQNTLDFLSKIGEANVK